MVSLPALLFGVKRSIEPIPDSEEAQEGAVMGEGAEGAEQGEEEAQGIIPDVAISERHSDEITVTSHPVDVGAQISDHAYKMPSIVVCTFGWSDSSRLINSIMSGSIFRGLEGVNDVYEKLLKLMEERKPVKLTTKKRTYPTMLITKLETVTTADSENSATIEITFQEILTASTQTVTLATVQSDPSKTGAVTNGNSRTADIQQQLTYSGAHG